MTDRLLYVYDEPGPDLERIELARRLGFDVSASANRAHGFPTESDQLHDALRGYQGLWADLDRGLYSIETARLLVAAHEAGVRLMGHMRTTQQAEEGLRIFIGLPGEDQSETT